MFPRPFSHRFPSIVGSGWVRPRTPIPRQDKTSTSPIVLETRVHPSNSQDCLARVKKGKRAKKEGKGWTARLRRRSICRASSGDAWRQRGRTAPGYRRTPNNIHRIPKGSQLRLKRVGGGNVFDQRIPVPRLLCHMLHELGTAPTEGRG